MIVWTDYPIGSCRIMCPYCGTRPTVKNMGVTILGEDCGLAHCFKCRVVVRRSHERRLTPHEHAAMKQRMAELQRQRGIEQRQRQAEVAADAASRWEAASPAIEHPYLTVKGIKAHGTRIERGRTLLVPMRNSQGDMKSLQFISTNGDKKFMPGGLTRGCYFAIGKPAEKLVVVEGFATGATVHEDTGLPVAVAFNAGNLMRVAKVLRAKFPSATLVIGADDDHGTAGNPGLTAATEAAKAVNGLLAVPNFAGLARGDGDTDFNDLRRLAGKVEVHA